ncbi:glycosyltransferase family 87 protein [Micromonospora sp. NPDC000089]|uniref:glycosyltransferase family 87 protein n=1 Tax=unclassified Micromonospora TaxID=2617518 RepID=UPI003699D2FC
MSRDVLPAPAQSRRTRRLTLDQRRALGVAVVAVAIGVAVALVPGHRGWFDVGVYHGAVGHWLAGGELYDWKTWNDYGFTYPPFAALCMVPLATLPWYPAITVSVLGSVLAGAFLLWLLVDPLARRHGWSRWFAFAVAACLLAMLNPVRDTVSFGQVNLVLLALVWADLWLLERGRRSAGIGIGLAAAIKLTPAIFIGYLLVTRRWRAAAVAAGTAAGATLVAAAVAPDASRTYFLDTLWDTSRVGKLEYISNQSLMGLVARLDPTHPSRLAWLTLVALALGVWAVRARRAVRLGDERAGFALTGVVGCLVSPVTWVHHLVWLVPALVALVASTLPWLPRDGSARRRLYAAGGAFLVLVSGLVWLWANDIDGLPGLLGGGSYTLVAVGLLVLLPIGADGQAGRSRIAANRRSARSS